MATLRLRRLPGVLECTLPEHHWVYGANLDMDASYRDTEGRLVNRRRQFGTMVLSRLPIASSRNHLLPKYGTLTQHSIQQGALEAVIVTPAQDRCASTRSHLSHLSAATRLPQVDALLDIHARAPSEGGAWCGGHPDPERGMDRGRDATDARGRDPDGRFQLRLGRARICPHRRTCDGAIWSPQSLDWIRRRVGRSRTSGRRRRDNSTPGSGSTTAWFPRRSRLACVRRGSTPTQQAPITIRSGRKSICRRGPRAWLLPECRDQHWSG